MLSFVVYPAQQLSPFLCPTNRPSQLPLTQVPLRAAAMLAAHGVPAARSPALDVNTPCGPLVSCLFPFQEEKCGKPDSLVRASVLQPVSQWLWRSPAFLCVNKSLLPLIGLLSIYRLVERTAPRNSAALASDTCSLSAPLPPPVVSTRAKCLHTTHDDSNSPRNSAALAFTMPRVGAASDIPSPLHSPFRETSGAARSAATSVKSIPLSL